MKHLIAQWQATAGAAVTLYRGVRVWVEGGDAWNLLSWIEAGRDDVVLDRLLREVVEYNEGLSYGGVRALVGVHWSRTEAIAMEEFASKDNWVVLDSGISIPVVLVGTVDPSAEAKDDRYFDYQRRDWEDEMSLVPGAEVQVSEVRALVPNVGWRGHKGRGRDDGGRWISKPVSMQVTAGDKTPPEERLKAKIKKKDGCWIFDGAIRRDGYGSFDMGNGKIVGAHVAAWDLWVGTDRGKKLLLHSCNNKTCINPKHLRLGDHKENAEDETKRKEKEGSRRLASTTYYHGTVADLGPGDVLVPQGSGSNYRPDAYDTSHGVFLTNDRATAFFYAVLGGFSRGDFDSEPRVFEVAAEARLFNHGEWVAPSAEILRDVTAEAKSEFAQDWEQWRDGIAASVPPGPPRRMVLHHMERIIASASRRGCR